MPKDERYITVRNLILGGYIKAFNEMFPTIPKSVMAKDVGISIDRFDKMRADMTRFNIGKLFEIAALLEVSEIAILNLVHNQFQADKKGRKKK